MLVESICVVKGFSKRRGLTRDQHFVGRPADTEAHPNYLQTVFSEETETPAEKLCSSAERVPGSRKGRDKELRSGGCVGRRRKEAGGLFLDIESRSLQRV